MNPTPSDSSEKNEPQGDFHTWQAWTDLDRSVIVPKIFRPEKVQTNIPGLSWGVWPFFMEEYRSDTEPVIQKSEKPLRFIAWKRERDSIVPNGWWSFSKKPEAKIGYVDLSCDYEKNFSKSLRYDAKYWKNELLSKKYTVSSITYDEFSALYAVSPVAKKIGNTLVLVLKDLLERNPGRISLWGVKKIDDQSLQAGVAILHSPRAQSSYYFAACHKSGTSNHPLILGLLLHWFEIAKQAGEKYAELGRLRQEHEPKAWAGFSAFKAKFGLTYQVQPNVLYKIKFRGT